MTLKGFYATMAWAPTCRPGAERYSAECWLHACAATGGHHRDATDLGGDAGSGGLRSVQKINGVAVKQRLQRIFMLACHSDMRADGENRG